jgi:hypothetical protein
LNKAATILFLLFSTSQICAKSLTTNRIEHAPNIDGVISYEEWVCVDSATAFTQLEPFSGDPSSEHTVAFICYDDAFIYVAFKCYTSNIDDVVVNIRTRDALEKSDDHIFVMFDSFGDNRSSFVFAVNPLATQTDLRVVDDGRSLDERWDAEWQAATQKTKFGWSAELAIPFASLKYDQSLTTWGLNFGRVIRANSETSYWSGSINDDFRVSQGGQLRDIQTPRTFRPFKFVPYATVRHNNLTQNRKQNGWNSEFGGDVFYNITPSLTANATYNPDFATVEGDVYQINLTRWELQFPEKRLFFLEGQELFNTRIRSFYSRRIGDIDYGGKIVGKVDKYSISAIGAQTVGDIQAGTSQATWGVARAKRDIFNSSSVGLTAVNQSLKGNNAGSISADYVLNLGKSWKLTGQWVSSWPATDELLKRSAWFVRFARESNIYHYHIRYSDTGELFRDTVNQTGFIKEDDMRELDSDVTRRWWIKNSNIEYLDFESRNNIFWNHAGDLRSWNFTDQFRLYLKNRMSLDLVYNNEFKLYEKKFYNHRYQAKFGYNTDEWQSAQAAFSRGRNYDRDFSLLEASTRYRPDEHIALHYSFKKLIYTPDTESLSTQLNILSMDYNFTRDIWLRILAQHSTRAERLYFYGLFGWRFQPPFGAVYLVYTVDENQPLDQQFKNQNRVLFIKFSYQL